MIFFIFTLSVSCAFSGTIRHDVPEIQYLNFGKRFFCVKKIVGVKNIEGNKVYSVGTCVILNNNWIITCAHITEEQPDYIVVMINDKAHLLDEFIVHKNYDSKKIQADLGLGFCKKGFGDVNGAKLYEEKLKLNDYCGLAGYGQHGKMSIGVNGYDGKLRAGTNRIDSFFKKDMVIINASEDITKTQLEFLPNVGDSGGGLFVKGKLAGITSLVLSKDKKSDSSYGDEAAFVQIYPYIEWINKYVKKK